jgi:BirA family biotin operon repressor/biotin-[acetyl-CoA-carboxylase] ligase
MGWLGRPLELVDETGSTNDDVLARARAGAAPGLVIVAGRQTRGRGRVGRAWSSPPGNLYLSALVPPPAIAAQTPALTLAAAVAVHDALNAAGCAASIKWPNDVLHDGKKLAGILTESSSRGGLIEAIVIGIGVNLNGEIPDELAPVATSVRAVIGRDLDRLGFAADLLARLEVWLDRHRAEGPRPIAAAWKQRALAFGRRVEAVVDGAPVAGLAHDLDDDGALIVTRDGGGDVRIVSGEVRLL